MSKQAIHWCRKKVFSRQSYGSYACGNKAIHDPDANGIPTHCGTHSLAAIERRKQRSDEGYKQYRRVKDAEAAVRSANAALLPVLEQIAAGHNDPRQLAIEAIGRLKGAEAALKALKP